ncbi:MAG: 1-acyl-sn-glycerol-3-phosphate acyltransferase [Deltaproteobacteria bacterium]|nr:1-acyl-sn-glycerol-3-phosphate acyltransferase [Deltaproteobacteria bacterium]
MKNPVKITTDWAFAIGWTFGCSFLTTTPLIVSPGGEISQWVVRKIWVPGLLRYFGVEVIAHGQENLPSAGTPCLLMPHHQSWFDILAIFATNPLNLRFVAKESLFKVPFFGTYLRLAGYIPIDRSNHEKAVASLDRAAERIRAGTPIVIFPEGTVSPDGEVGPFKKGPFMLALKAGVPIIPVAITGSRAVLTKGDLELRPGTIRLRYCEPLDISGYGLGDRDRLMSQIREILVREKARLESPTGREERG